MRAVTVAVVLVVACASDDGPSAPAPSSSAGCPEPRDLVPGAACALPTERECFHLDTFSSCRSGTCRCDGGIWDCQGLGATDGASCAGSPLASCSYEGVPSCDTPPTAEACVCDDDGTWHCVCACYGGSGAANTCGPTCPARFIPELDGAGCQPPLECVYPEATCRCVDDGLGGGRLTCT